MNYENMSDFEINAAVSMHALWKNRHCEEVDCNDKTGVVSWADGANWHEFNPCNDPSDAWPIIVESKIDIQHRDGFGTPCARNCEHMCAHKNPLRAAMIVFLMMRDE